MGSVLYSLAWYQGYLRLKLRGGCLFLPLLPASGSEDHENRQKFKNKKEHGRKKKMICPLAPFLLQIHIGFRASFFYAV